MGLRRMRWASDDGGGVGGGGRRWELDMEVPVTMEGTARAVPGDPLPLGLSRGPRLTRPKQLDFMHRFMASPLVPSFSGDRGNGARGILLHHAHTLHLSENWSTTLLEQIDLQKLLSSFKELTSNHMSNLSWPKTIVKHMADIFTIGLGTELLLTPDSSVLLEAYDVKKGNRGKAILHHKFPKHNLTFEAAWPGLFVDKMGTYWDVPLSMAVDLASIASGSGLSYHLCLQHNSGQPNHFGGNQATDVPSSLLPGLCAKAAVSIKETVDIWRKRKGMLRMVQPYDVFLSEPHISASGVIGAVANASLGECSLRFAQKDELQKHGAFSLCAQKDNLALFADIFASVSCTAQHGNFQRLFLDLSRFSAQLEIPSGSKFLSGATQVAQKLYNSQQLDLKEIQDICPDLAVSLQQQIVGPFSFRVDSRIVFEPKDRYHFARLDESLFAIDWALKVLGSAKATAWYSPKRQEAMVELRFFES